MANPIITQNGVVFARRPDEDFAPGQALTSLTSAMVDSSLVATVSTTSPFLAIRDEQGTYWRLRDRDVVYGADNVKINLYSIYEIRNMITTQATIKVSDANSSMTLSRYRESDPIRGFAWRNGNAAIYTKSPVASSGMVWYTDPNLITSGGTTTSASYPGVSGGFYKSGWSVVLGTIPAGLSYTVVSSGTYGTNNNSNR